MTVIDDIIACLERTPAILRHLLDQVPVEHLKLRRLPDKWSVHEQVCHLAEAQGVLEARFRQFEAEENPLIRAYTPPAGRPENHYLSLDMESELRNFTATRKAMVAMLKALPQRYWLLEGRHEEFSPYNTRLLLTHTLNVDYAHVFSIEQLGLTRRDLESGIMTLP